MCLSTKSKLFLRGNLTSGVLTKVSFLIAELHTHIGKVKKTHELIFSWLSWPSGIARGRVRTIATESRNIAAMLSQRNAPSANSGSMPSFLCGIFKEKKTKDSRG